MPRRRADRAKAKKMPLTRYFVFVGGVLLALLLIANACLPALPVAEVSRSSVDRSVIRIHSDKKWPERVVFDTSRPTIAPVPAPAVVVAEAPSPPKTAAVQPVKTAAVQPVKGRVREAYAQLRPNPNELRSPEPKRNRKSVAKNYVGPPRNPVAPQPPRILVAQQPPRILVAQQRPVVFFGNNVW